MTSTGTTSLPGKAAVDSSLGGRATVDSTSNKESTWTPGTLDADAPTPGTWALVDLELNAERAIRDGATVGATSEAVARGILRANSRDIERARTIAGERVMKNLVGESIAPQFEDVRDRLNSILIEGIDSEAGLIGWGRLRDYLGRTRDQFNGPGESAQLFRALHRRIAFTPWSEVRATHVQALHQALVEVVEGRQSPGRSKEALMSAIKIVRESGARPIPPVRFSPLERE